MLLALFVVPPGRVACSVLAAVLMSLFLWVDHKPGAVYGDLSCDDFASYDSQNHQSSTLPRDDLMSERWLLPSSRRCFEP